MERHESTNDHAPFSAGINKVLIDMAGSIRQEILFHLADGEQCVSSLAAAMQLDGNTVSYHLRKLLDHGFVVMQINGTEHRYAIGPRVEIILDEDGFEMAIDVPHEPGNRITIRCRRLPHERPPRDAERRSAS